MKRCSLDKACFGFALTLAVASAAWFGWRRHDVRRGLTSARSKAKPNTSKYVTVIAELDHDGPSEWLAPSGQSRGPEWRYELFTPPGIIYDPETGEFAVKRVEKTTGPAELADDSELRLVEVKRALFPIQLLGYVGGGGRYIGSFERTDTGNAFLAGAGRDLADLGFRIEDLAVQRRDVTIAGRTYPNQWVAIATVREMRTGELTTLTAGQRLHTNELLAVVAVKEDGDEAIHELRRGEEFHGATRTYLIDRLELEPAIIGVVANDPAATAPVRLELNAQDTEDASPTPVN